MSKRRPDRTGTHQRTIRVCGPLVGDAAPEPAVARPLRSDPGLHRLDVRPP
jgi:hypothetical protein